MVQGNKFTFKNQALTTSIVCVCVCGAEHEVADLHEPYLSLCEFNALYMWKYENAVFTQHVLHQASVHTNTENLTHTHTHRETVMTLPCTRFSAPKIHFGSFRQQYVMFP